LPEELLQLNQLFFQNVIENFKIEDWEAYNDITKTKNFSQEENRLKNIFDNVYIDKSVLVEYDDLSEAEEALPEESGSVKTMPIDALPLSERTRNALIKNNILYVEDLEKKKKSELLVMK